MLLTLASISGLYGISNQILMKKNKNLLKSDVFLSLRGKKSIGQITISKNSILYKINYIKDNNFTVNNKILTYETQKFNSTEECKNFCINNKLEFDNSIYNKIVIDDPSSENIWLLRYSDKYTIMKKMSCNDFKNQIIKTNQLPFNKLNIILLVILIIMCYESNI